ncbi:hypothetical protein TPY_0392 [Sulfobacillus acidophilus TPY]|uniref:DUF962 domain-containing protein n=1 Tax=Sulfobacillus acidophilus (strain ATCC 700253 / DSM 10332 / NAL) TaxID=679936 RepID=G8TY19_SULAD|nr:hypothetical protein TPY_0392 [Sulfobacillus acidophilus TPY]AEW03926.1 Protein of unknown function DUF2253, membrane [Sulfobacillus acidophilus DSM 10332]
MSSDGFYDFWMEYLNGHQLLATRLWHFAGTAIAVMTAVLAIIAWNPIYLVGAFLLGYGSSWVAHTFLEHNHPLSWKHPLWALWADITLVRLMLVRGLTEDVGKFKWL